jgi:SAM-dependent methyltransferase
VRAAGRGRVIGVGLSRRTLHDAARHNPDPLVGGDNTSLPIRSDAADLVISNGVIMLTPDARAPFVELVRVTKPGGTLVVPVYDRRSWYYPVYRHGSPSVRRLRDWIGEAGLRPTLFPLWHVGVLLLVAAITRRPFWIPLEVSWNLFHDQLTTPDCTFHSVEELVERAQAAGCSVDDSRLEAARQLVTLRLTKAPGS